MDKKLLLVIIACSIVLIGGLIYGLIEKNKNSYMELDGVKIPTYVYEEAKERFDGAIGFEVCDMEDKGCLVFVDPNKID